MPETFISSFEPPSNPRPQDLNQLPEGLVDKRGTESPAEGFERDEETGAISLEDVDPEGTLQFPNLVGDIQQKYQESKENRFADEIRWLKAYQNYRGVYDADTLSKIPDDNSRIFVKITKSKTQAAYGQLVEVIFSSGRFPISVEPTKVPEGVAEYAHFPENQQSEEETPSDNTSDDVLGFPGDGNDLKPGATADSILGGLKDKFKGLMAKKGPTDNPEVLQINPAQIAAKNMEKQIHDQLEESHAGTCLRHAAFEMALLGHGIIKGPFNYYKEVHKWTKKEGEETHTHTVEEKLVPRIEAVSLWGFYPDPDAVSIEDADWVIQRHLFNRAKMRELIKRPYFRHNAIITTLRRGPNHVREWFEQYLKDSEIHEDGKLYEILEYWGTIDARSAQAAGLLVEGEFDDELDTVQINAWVCGDQLLRLVLNPFTPARIPYHACPYEMHPYQFFGIGVPENMSDSQAVMNGHARMAIDNLKLAGNLVLDIDEASLVPGQDMRIYPGKIFRRQSGQPGAAIHSIKFQNTAPANMDIFDRFRQLADEQTGIPSYSHGQTGIQSTTRTAAGMSMLMGAAALSIKTVIKNIDDFLLQPLGEAFYAWNMQFNKDMPEIKGDLEVRSRGTAALMQKEVRSQRLTQFMQIASSPMLAPFIKWSTLLREMATTLDLDPEKLINDPQEAAIAARIIGDAQGNSAGGTTPPQEPGGVPSSAGLPPAQDKSIAQGVGNGTIGTGNTAMPGEDKFSASTPITTGRG